MWSVVVLSKRMKGLQVYPDCNSDRELSTTAAGGRQRNTGTCHMPETSVSCALILKVCKDAYTIPNDADVQRG